MKIVICQPGGHDNKTVTLQILRQVATTKVAITGDTGLGTAYQMVRRVVGKRRTDAVLKRRRDEGGYLPLCWMAWMAGMVKNHG